MRPYPWVSLAALAMLATSGLAQESLVPRPDRFGLALEQQDGPKVVVFSVVAGSAADSAGVEAGDELVSLDDVPVADVSAAESTLAVVEEGQKVQLELLRNGQAVHTTLVWPQQPLATEPAVDPAPAGVGFMGMLLQEATPGVVVVSRVSPHTPAELAGIRAGDRLLAVERQRAAPLDELVPFSIKLLDGMAPGDIVQVRIANDNNKAKVIDLVVQEAIPPEKPNPTPLIPGDVLTAVGISLLERPSGTVRVTSVVDHSPAAVAGLRRGDILVAVDALEIHSAADAVAALAPHQVEDTLPVEILRDAQPIATAVTLRAEPAELADYIRALQAENEMLARTIEMLSKELESQRVTPAPAAGKPTRRSKLERK